MEQSSSIAQRNKLLYIRIWIQRQHLFEGSIQCWFCFFQGNCWKLEKYQQTNPLWKHVIQLIARKPSDLNQIRYLANEQINIFWCRSGIFSFKGFSKRGFWTLGWWTQMNKTNVAHVKGSYGYIYRLVHTESKYKLNQNNRLIDSVVFFTCSGLTPSKSMNM